MPSAEQHVSDEAAHHLRLVLDKCRDIEVRVLGWSSRGKTFDLARDRIIHHLVPRVRQYAGELLDLHGSPAGPEDALDGNPPKTYCRSRLGQCLKHLLEVFSLFNQLQACQSHLDFDDLDAYYAESFIVNDKPTYNPRDAANRYRTALAMARLMLTSNLGPLASRDNTTWGLPVPGHVVPDTSTATGTALMDVSKLVIEQSMPRYIHTYTEQPPYHWDNSADPAHGSFGLIRKATSEITGEVVAIKIINRCFSDKDCFSIAREIGALEVCHHPSLIQLVDAYETSDDVRLVLMPWAPFILFMFLSKSDKALSVSYPWSVPGQQSSMDIVLGMQHGLADGLHYLHLKLIKHKDIKPENILLHHEGSKGVRPIIADFGTSRVYKVGGRTRFTDSTYMYLASEQVNHTGSSLKSDVWQLGCCFAQILTRACGGYTASLVLSDSYQNTDEMRSCTIAKELGHFLCALRRLCAATPDLLELICGMLEEDPAARWTIAQVHSELVRMIQDARLETGKLGRTPVEGERQTCSVR